MMKTASMRTKNNELYIGQYKCSDLVTMYKSPLYVYDEEAIRKKMDLFLNYFKSNRFNTKIVYASKAFIAPYLCDMLEEKGLGIDAVSGGDLYLLEKNHFPMQDVVYHGNYKSNEELENCVRLNVGYVVVDSLRELNKLAKLSNKQQQTISTLFRVNPGIEAHTHEYIQTSLLSSKFGESIFDRAMMKKIIDVYQSSPYLELKGFHAHIGSQINSVYSFVKSTKTMMQFARDFQKASGMLIGTINLGGGFGIQYESKDKKIDLKRMLQKIVETAERYMDKYGLHIECLMIEPGRSIVGDAGVTLYNCGGTKKTFGGKSYVFVDGGMGDNIRPALYQAKYTVALANKVRPEKLVVYDIVGKYCESGDIIARDVQMGETHEGDTVIVYATGAYCYSMSSNYNGAVRGAVIFVRGKQITEAIRRQDYEDMLSTYYFKGGKSVEGV